MEFDNELFEVSSAEKRKQITVLNEHIYSPKQCPPEWFMSIDDIINDDYMTLKYKGDLLFYKEEYRDALKIYKNILSSLPPTHGKVKRELEDSIAQCILHCNDCSDREKGGEEREKEKEKCKVKSDEKDDFLIWNNVLVQHPHDKDSSSWQLRANWHKQNGRNFEETLARGQCCLLQRHYGPYWEQLSHSFYKLSLIDRQSLSTDQIKELVQIIITLLRPYVRTIDQNSSLEHSPPGCTQFIQLIIHGHSSLSADSGETACHMISNILQLSSCASLIWAKQLLSYSCSHSKSFAAVSQSVKYTEICSTLTHRYLDTVIQYLSSCMIKATILDL